MHWWRKSSPWALTTTTRTFLWFDHPLINNIYSCRPGTSLMTHCGIDTMIFGKQLSMHWYWRSPSCFCGLQLLLWVRTWYWFIDWCSLLWWSTLGWTRLRWKWGYMLWSPKPPVVLQRASPVNYWLLGVSHLWEWGSQQWGYSHWPCSTLHSVN